MKSLTFAALIFFLAPVSLAQQWVRVAGETDTVTATTAVTYRYGTASGTTYAGVDCSTLPPQCWNTPQTGTLTSFVVSYTTLGDSAPGLSKEFDVLQTTAPQTIIVNGGTVTIPALPAPPPPSTPFPAGAVVKAAVANIPPTSPTAPLAAVVTLTLKDGTVAKLVCLYNTTVANTDTPPSLAAMFSCVVQ